MAMRRIGLARWRKNDRFAQAAQHIIRPNMHSAHAAACRHNRLAGTARIRLAGTNSAIRQRGLSTVPGASGVKVAAARQSRRDRRLSTSH
jgi:hypothetical protein